jgi:O-antigen ligase
MAFALTLLYLFLTFVRIPEIYPELAPWRIMLWMSVISLAVSVFQWFIAKVKPTLKAPQFLWLAGFLWMVAFSLLMKGWFGGIIEAFQDWVSTLTAFTLIVLNVTTLRRLRIVAGLLVLCGVILVSQGLAALHYGIMAEQLIFAQTLFAADGTPLLAEDDSATPYGGGEEFSGFAVLPRIRNLGFLHDPNDLAQVLLMLLPFLFLAWRKERRIRSAFLTLPVAGFLLYGVYLTRSRGGLVSLMVMLLLALRERWGKVKAAIITGVLGGAFLALNVAGRSMSDGSSVGRFDAWTEGIMMVRSSPLWGIGYGLFMEHHIQTAHNSFVLAFAELGLVGFYFWMGLLVITLTELTLLVRLPQTDPHTELYRRWGRATRLSLLVFLTASFFLSRTYIPTLYLLLAVAIAVTDLARRSNIGFRSLSLLHYARHTAYWSAGMLVVIYGLIKLQALRGS